MGIKLFFERELPKYRKIFARNKAHESADFRYLGCKCPISFKEFTNAKTLVYDPDTMTIIGFK